jgi:hypothetical protein
LANSRGASRIGSTILTFLPPEFPIAVDRGHMSPEPRTMLPTPPSPNRIPPIHASQGPPDRPPSPAYPPVLDGQFLYALSAPNDNGIREKVPFCRYCQVRGHTEAVCIKAACLWCDAAHPSLFCPNPHFGCSDLGCRVPLSHSNHGVVCPQLIGEEDMDMVGEKNCDYCEEVADHTHD